MWVGSWRLDFIYHPDISEEDKKNLKDYIVIHWHQDIFAILRLLKIYKVIVIVSQSNDGNLITDFIEQFGGIAARGSKRRGGVSALLKAISLAKKNDIFMGIAVDGSKGPRFYAKAGAEMISKKTGRKIVPLRAFPKRYWLVKKAWDHHRIPLPFSKISYKFDKPFVVPPTENPEEFLTKKLNSVKLDNNETK